MGTTKPIPQSVYSIGKDNPPLEQRASRQPGRSPRRGVSTSVTTNETSGELHDRMPVFLEPEVFDRWLDTERLSEDAQKADMLAMLDHVSGEVASTITTYEVDRKVNNSRTVDPSDESLIAALQS